MEASNPRTPPSSFESGSNDDRASTSKILVISLLAQDFMDPSEDIIDVLYRFREDPTANHNHHRRGTPTHRFFQRHDSVDGANLTGRYPIGGVSKQRSVSLQLEREEIGGALEENGPDSIYGERDKTRSSVQGRIEAHPRNVRVDVIPQCDEEPYILKRRANLDLVELPNGVRTHRKGLNLQKSQAFKYHHPSTISSSNHVFGGGARYGSFPRLISDSRSSLNLESNFDPVLESQEDDFYNSFEKEESCRTSEDVYSSIGGLSTVPQKSRNTEGSTSDRSKEEISSFTDKPVVLSSKNTQTENEEVAEQETCQDHRVNGKPNGKKSSSALVGKQDFGANERNSTTHRTKPMMFLRVGNWLLGVGVMIVLAYHWAGYLAQLHDNQFWFVNIKEVEREISFRTEQGLYYSYYKQLVRAPTVEEGMAQLRSDTITEHGRTINIFHRFNIHQELFLAALYRVINFGLRPIFFYIYSVFSLQGMFLCAMYLITWNLSGTWLSGVLMTAFLVCHRMNVTRVEFTIPLREHFSLPFIFSQFFAIGLYFDSKGRKYEKLHLMSIYLFTFLLTVTWQFAQFVLLLQGLVLFAFAILGILENNKVSKIMATTLTAIVTVWYLQFYQPMVLNSLVVSLVPVAIVILQSYNEGRVRRPGIWNNLQWSIVKIILGIISTIALNTLVKIISGQDADNHIFRFVQSKFGFVDQTDFETRLYLCLPIFQPLPWQYYLAMNETGSMSLYCSFVILEVTLVVMSVFWHWHHKVKSEDKAPKHQSSGIYHWFRSNGDLDFIRDRKMSQGWCFHIGQSLILAVLAMTTLRMKCFWGPYICIFSSVMVCHPDLWSFVVSKLGGGRGNWKLTNLLRHIILASCIFALYSSHKSRINDELDDLKEFHDPDTVELMEWIPKQTPPNAAFTGSMQLLAGVKLCTGRPLTNHPHFEDKELRQRTKELYQIYARKSPQEVHDILVKYNTSYIILEDSICLSRSENRCNLPTTMDLTNGHIPDDGIRDPPHLVHAPNRRFCDEIRKGHASFTTLFKKVFENRTFRVYQVLSAKKAS